MATAKRLYLYGVSAAGIGMLACAAVAMLHLLLNKAGVGPQTVGGTLTSNADRDVLSVAISLGVIGLILWLTHWAMVERMVHRPGEAAAAERASIVRSVFFVAVLSTTLLVATALVVQLLSNSLANIVDKPATNTMAGTASISSFPDDAWSLAVIIVMVGAWAYSALVRARDLRQGTFIGGAAAWVARFYLYGAALIGLFGILQGISGIISVFGSQIFEDSMGGSSSGTPWWVRPVIGLVVGIVIWGIVWLTHWLYSNRLRHGRGDATEQNLAERASRVRLAFLMAVVFMGVLMVFNNVATSLMFLIEKLLGADISKSSLGYSLVVPPLAAIPYAVVWFLHRRRGIGESAEGPAGVSARRIAGYTTAIVALYAIATGAADILSAVFGEWLPGPTSHLGSYSAQTFEPWKYTFSLGLGAVLVGLALYIWPWFCAQRRRRVEGEIGSSSRSYYLYVIVGASILLAAGSLALIMYRYLRLAFGLTETNLGPEVSGLLAILLVAVLMFAYHAFVLRSDSRPRVYAPPGMSAWPGYPGLGAYPPAGPFYGAPQGYPPAGPVPPVWPTAPVKPVQPVPPAAPADVAPEATPHTDASPEAGA